MPALIDNRAVVRDELKGSNNNFTESIRDVFGWMFVIGLLLSIGAWRLHWVENLVTAILSAALFAGVFAPLLGYQISKILHRQEPAASHIYARFKKQ